MAGCWVVGCAGACRNVPETPNLRSARPSATWPPFCDTREKLMRFCAWTWTYPGPTAMNAMPTMPTLNTTVSGNLRNRRTFLLRLRGIVTPYPIFFERIERIILLFPRPNFHLGLPGPVQYTSDRKSTRLNSSHLG